uniref:protocadherin beta-16-like n=1 Tax=Styela clava TaxID=7725 RepID=UPI00193AC00C|nr:protocadherin beta-16-like [Styela clava]
MRSFGLTRCRSVLAYAVVLVVCIPRLRASQPGSGKYRIDFPEEQEPGTVVAKLAELFSVRAAELTGRTFEILGQRMIAGHKEIASDGKWLKINRQTGVITVNQPVDRETECGNDPELECVILLQTAMMPQAHFRLQDFELVVTDVNDHAPKFPKTGGDRIFSLNISEDTPELTKISLDQYLASDEDINENAMIHYSISRNDHFGLNQYKDDTGAAHLELVIVSSLDYEDTTTFDLTLTAKDRGSPAPRSSQVFLRINVLDANDNYPKFDESVYNLELRENLPAGHVITTVVARDADSGRFGKVRYFIPKAGNSVTVQNLITVEPETGAVKLLQPLDREVRKNLRIVIGARDQATKEDGGSKTGKTVLMIQIVDVNDNPPRIHVNIILKGEDKAAYVPEDAQLGTYVAHVSATDADSGESGRVTLKLTTEIDRSTHSGLAGLQAAGSRQISRKPPGSFVSDNFILKSGNLIATNARMDRETQDRYTIKITACDNGNPKKCSEKNVSVVILDANDHKPQFRSSQKSFTLSENTQIGSYITTVTAYDEDSLNTPALIKTKDGKFADSRNGQVRYSLTGGGAVFAIDSKSGKLTLVGRLDYEMKRLWRLIVTAQDMGEPPHKTNLTLLVKVTDVNDHKPEFTNPGVENMTAYATILEDHPIIRIKTIDRDAGNNAKVWYSIALEDGAKPPFKFLIDPVTGSLRLNSSNKLTELLGEHTLVIKARDKGNPPQEAQTRLIIKVTDVPLASIIPNYADSDEARESSKITVIVLATLASATVILLLVLACIVIKCRKENKEIRTYNCRAAETKSGRAVNCASKSSMSQIGSVDEVVVVSTPGVTTTKDIHFGRAMEINRSRSMTLANGKLEKNTSTDTKYATTERGGPTFSTFSYSKKNGVNQLQPVTTTHTDRDSGKGESDKDSDSYGGEKDIQGTQTPSESNLQYCSGYLNELGPRCTISCRKYGHSDECWMPVVAHCDIHGEHDSFIYSDAGSETSDNTALSNHNYADQQQFVPTTNSLPGRYGAGNFDNCGLETISETQPLRIVLDTGDQSSMYSCESYNQHEYPTYGQSYPTAQYSKQQMYSPSYYQSQNSQNHYFPEEGDWRDMYRSQQQTTNDIPTTQSQTRPVLSRPYLPPSNNLPRSHHSNNGSSSSISSSSCVPCEMPEMYRVAPARPLSVCENNGDASTGSVMEKVKRFSQAPVRRNSLRDHVIHTRFLNSSMTEDVSDSRAEETALLRDVKNSSFHNPEAKSKSFNGEVSLEETQKIISDIDNLISS